MLRMCTFVKEPMLHRACRGCTSWVLLLVWLSCCSPSSVHTHASPRPRGKASRAPSGDRGRWTQHSQGRVRVPDRGICSQWRGYVVDYPAPCGCKVCKPVGRGHECCGRGHECCCRESYCRLHTAHPRVKGYCVVYSEQHLIIRLRSSFSPLRCSNRVSCMVLRGFSTAPVAICCHVPPTCLHCMFQTGLGLGLDLSWRLSQLHPLQHPCPRLCQQSATGWGWLRSLLGVRR
jgi:hypothetical protein